MLKSIDNEERASLAYTAVAAFAAETGQAESGCLERDIGSVITDLLTNLMHLCQRGIDNDKHGEIEFSSLLRMAEMHFDAEENEEE